MSDDVTNIGVYIRVKEQGYSWFYDDESETYDKGYRLAGKKGCYRVLYKNIVDEYTYNFNGFIFSKDAYVNTLNSLIRFCLDRGIEYYTGSDKLYMFNYYNGVDHPLNHLDCFDGS